jgi:hypothetical protein
VRLASQSLKRIWVHELPAHMAAVGERLGVTENAAAKRIEPALEKLRTQSARHGTRGSVLYNQPTSRSCWLRVRISSMTSREVDRRRADSR